MPLYRLSGIGIANNNAHYMITESHHLYKDTDEQSFPFKYTCNNDKRVYYTGNFIKTTITYSDRDSRVVSGIQVSYSIDLVDCAKLSRDFENLRMEHINSIVDQLLYECIDLVKDNIINVKDQVFNVNIM